MNDRELLVKFSHFFGRQGSLSSVFITSKAQLALFVGAPVHFGEVLGKHSEVYLRTSEKDFTVLIDDPHLVEILGDALEKHLPFGNVSIQGGIERAQEAFRGDGEGVEDDIVSLPGEDLYEKRAAARQLARAAKPR